MSSVSLWTHFNGTQQEHRVRKLRGSVIWMRLKRQIKTTTEQPPKLGRKQKFGFTHTWKSWLRRIMTFTFSDWKHGSYPEVIFADGTFSHIHPTALGLKMLIERLIKDEAIDEGTTHIQVRVLPMNVQRDVFPLRIRQVHVLKRHHILRAVHPVHQVQCVGATVWHNLELPAAARTLQPDQRSPRGAVLADGGHEHEAFIILDLL